MGHEWKAPGGYEVEAGSWGVSISNDSDDSSGATTLKPEQALELGWILCAAGAAAKEDQEKR